MTDEDVLAVKVIGGTMACGFILLLVTLDDECATTLQHVATITVEVRSVNLTTAPHSHTIVALVALAAVVPRHEEVIIAVVLHDERCLNGIGASILRRWVRLGFLEVRCIATCDGAWLFTSSDVHGAVETYHLDTVPEGAPHQPRLIVVVDDEVGVDGIPVVASFA